MTTAAARVCHAMALLVALALWVSNAWAQLAEGVPTPVDISEVIRIVDEEFDQPPKDWTAFDRAHAEYVAGFQRMNAGPAREFLRKQLEQGGGESPAALAAEGKRLTIVFVDAVTPLFPADSADSVQRLRERLGARIEGADHSSWIDDSLGLDLARMLRTCLRREPSVWEQVKPAVDRYRTARQPIWQRLSKDLDGSEACAASNAGEFQALGDEQSKLSERVEEILRAMREVESATVPDTEALAKLNSDLEAVNEEQQQMYRRWAHANNSCMAPASATASRLYQLDGGFLREVMVQLPERVRSGMRREIAAAFGVADDRSFDVELPARVLLRHRGLSAANKEAIRRVVMDWVQRDAPSFDRAIALARDARAQSAFMWDPDREDTGSAELEALAERRGAGAEEARERILQIASEAIGRERAQAIVDGTGDPDLDAPSADDPQLVADELDATDTDERPFDVMGMRVRELLGPSVILSPQLLSELCAIFAVPPATQQALEAVHHAYWQRVEGELMPKCEALFGERQSAAVELALDQPVPQAFATMDALAAEGAEVAASFEQATNEFWSVATGVLGAEGELVGSAMRTSASLANRQDQWAGALSPGGADPVRAALALAQSESERREVVARAASAEAALAEHQRRRAAAHRAWSREWHRNSLFWDQRFPVQQGERAAHAEEFRERAVQHAQEDAELAQRQQALADALAQDVAAVLGSARQHAFALAIAEQRAPDAFRQEERVAPVLAELLLRDDLPGALRVELLSEQDELAEPLAEAEAKLMGAIAAAINERARASPATGPGYWIGVQLARAAVTEAWWHRDELERRVAERVRRAVGSGLLPDGRLRAIREVEQSRYGL